MTINHWRDIVNLIYISKMYTFNSKLRRLTFESIETPKFEKWVKAANAAKMDFWLMVVTAIDEYCQELEEEI